MIERKIEEIGADKTLLLVDDDEPFLRRLTKAMEKRGFQVEAAGSVAAGRAIILNLRIWKANIFNKIFIACSG